MIEAENLWGHLTNELEEENMLAQIYKHGGRRKGDTRLSPAIKDEKYKIIIKDK